MPPSIPIKGQRGSAALCLNYLALAKRPEVPQLWPKKRQGGILFVKKEFNGGGIWFIDQGAKQLGQCVLSPAISLLSLA